MQIQINYGDIEKSDALEAHVHDMLDKELTHVADQVTRIEAHLRDDKQKRRGPDDKRCMLEARIAGEKPLAVESKAGDIYKAVGECAGKLGRAVTNRLERHDR
ncbi:MAG: HPF/RaiA family ribosome-associated protein [Phycisphaeraceae bacterium]|nr:HPF/RaiA family ribosome-associated protein [Phycisphaeraceae bacterium]